MNIILRGCFDFLSAYSFFYCIFTFIFWDWCVSKWGKTGRTIFIILILLLWIFFLHIDTMPKHP